MKASIKINQKKYEVNLDEPLDISIPLHTGPDNVRAWYVGEVKMEAVMNEFFTGDVNKGGAVNFRNVFFNPHGHGTHTECVGHISKENYTINQSLKKFFFSANLITMDPEKTENGDNIINGGQIEEALKLMPACEALVIRTKPNGSDKLSKNYSDTNPAYLTTDAIESILKHNIDHILIDLPSVDREVDGGKLAAHHLFWQYPENTKLKRSITELIYVPNEIPDGFYLLNIQFAPFENDASPSKPVLYRLNE